MQPPYTNPVDLTLFRHVNDEDRFFGIQSETVDESGVNWYLQQLQDKRAVLLRFRRILTSNGGKAYEVVHQEPA